ncbi:MAG: hypothetical protein JWN44_6563 [Myxococcales bacterium]|nr:hypothetical protein [Myxococcales bacterium]
MRWVPIIAVVATLAGCNTFDPKHPLVGKPTAFEAAPAIYVWVEDSNLWHVRFLGKGAHRFQGSVAGVRGGVLDLALTRPTLKDAIALAGDAVQFDVESSAAEADDGFDVRVVGSCARFDLYVDGRHHTERVRLGPRLGRPSKIPFDRCP